MLTMNKPKRVGPFILFRYTGNKGDFISAVEDHMVRDGVNFTGTDKIVFKDVGFNDDDFTLTHNSIAVNVRGDYEFDATVTGKKAIYRQGEGGFRMGPSKPWVYRSLSDNAIYDCYYPNDKTPRRWARVVGQSNTGDELSIPSKEIDQFLIITIGSVKVGEALFSATDKPVSLRILAGQSRKIQVVEDQTVWLRTWPETPDGDNYQEKV